MGAHLVWLQQKLKNQELRIEQIRGTINPAGLMKKHLDGKRLMMLRDLLSIKRISGRPSSTPNLTLDTEYISRASRALAALKLVRQAAASEISVPSGIEHETWTESDKLDGCWVDNRGCDDVLYRYGGKLDESLRRSATERKLWKRAGALKTN